MLKQGNMAGRKMEKNQGHKLGNGASKGPPVKGSGR